MIIDDHSRMIVGYGFFLEDNAVNVQTVLKRAIAKYGVPKRLYADNGKPYKRTVTDHLRSAADPDQSCSGIPWQSKGESGKSL